MQVSRKLLEEAVRLHGHLGPFLVFGLKMSLLAEKILDEKPQGCELETVNNKPFLCTVDGIKAVIGSNAITLREGDGLAAQFRAANGKEVVIRVKETLIKRYAEGPWERCKEYAHEVMRSKDEELFERTEYPSLKKRRTST